MDEQEFLERFGMTREEYGNKYGVLQDPNMGKGATLRQKSVDKVAGALQGLGSDQYSAYKTARDILGDADSSSIAESIGVLDFTPAQIPFAIQEAKRAYDRGDYLESGIGAGVAALEMAPGVKLASTPLKSFLRNLGTKSMTKETPIDPSRRNFLTKAGTTAVAAPLAVGALSEVPVGKIIDDVVPVTKKASPVVREFDKYDRTMSNYTYDWSENPQLYTDISREIFTEKTGLAKNKYDDYLMGERSMQNYIQDVDAPWNLTEESYISPSWEKPVDTIEDYAERMLGAEDAEKFLKKNKVDLNFYKTADISANDASDDLLERVVKGIDTGEEGLDEFDKLDDSFGDFNVEENLDSDFSINPLVKDSMLQETLGFGDMDWEEFIQTEGRKTTRFKELKSVIDEIDALAEAKNPISKEVKETRRRLDPRSN